MEELLKAVILARSDSQSTFIRTLAYALRALGAARRFVKNPRVRSEKITRLLRRSAHFQGATYTEPNRYPELFAACRRHLQHLPSPTILSFGCSTGEEAFTLAECLPQATIIGADINRWCLRQCIANNRNPRVGFLHGASAKFNALSHLDAIFCMAVFQRTENRINPASVAHGNFTFAVFEQQIRRLDSKLNPGGLFFIDHSDFSFEDTAIAAHYTPLDFAGNAFLHFRPLFGRDNRLVATQHRLPRAFLKKSAAPPQS